jgi:hypothetical protein
MLQEKSASNCEDHSLYSVKAVANLRVYKFMVACFLVPLVFVPVYAILGISSYLELLSAIETFAWTRDVSSPLLYFLVVVALPLSLWFVLRMAFIRSKCPVHTYCRGLSLPAEQYTSVNWRLGFHFFISLLSAGLVFVCGLQNGFPKVIKKPLVVKVTFTVRSVPTEHICLAFLIFELQLVLHMLHLESKFALKVSCPKAWKTRWRNLRTTVKVLLIGLCLVGVSRIYKTIRTDRHCWPDDEASITVAILIVSSIYGSGVVGACFRFILLTVCFRSLGDVDAKDQMLPAYQILLWSLATTLVHMIWSTKLYYKPSQRPTVLLAVMILLNAAPLLLKLSLPCVLPSM